MLRSRQGFTLIELMIVVSIIAVLASLAVPSLVSSKVAANEASAIASLRNLVSAQAAFKSTAAIDVDLDGAGEYGTFGEMSGLTALNLRGGVGGVATPLDPPVLGPPFEKVDANGCARKSGYLYLMYLPDAVNHGVPEAPNGGPGPGIDADRAEVLWSCYAFPVTKNVTGSRTFFVDQRGELLQTKMENVTYGTGLLPPYEAALTLADMASPPGIAANAIDTNTWKVVQ